MTSGSKTIAKNTLFLYLRMFFNMAVSLYTSRVILQVLGVENFGIYNLVGGVVVLFSFLNASMSAATQRYINVEIASKLVDRINKVFCVSLNIHVVISIVIIVLSETIGLWFLNYKLNIPSDRMYAANVVYQMSVITAVINIMRVPYNAVIISYEKMSYFAVLGVFETTAKLIIVYLLILFPAHDQLILYGILLVIINLLLNLLYFFYCRSSFKEQTAYHFYKDVSLFKELLSFSGWMLFGQVAVVGATQGLNMILNMFFGVVVNAALGIANQVNAAVYGFVSNFQMAFNPQIVQSYASGEFEKNKSLVLATSKYSFFLMAILAAPILYFTKDLLTLWLGNTLPEYVEGFVHIVILCSLLDALAGPFWMAAAAIGNIKKYNIVITIINLFTLPGVYILLKFGFNPVYAFCGKFLTSVIMQLFRYYFIHSYLKFKRTELIKYSTGIFIILGYLIILGLIASNNKIYSFVQIIIGSIFINFILVGLIYLVGLSRYERNFCINIIKRNWINNRH